MSNSHITIDSRFDCVRDVDTCLESFLNEAQVDAEDAYGTRVAVTEALNNVIEHGHLGRSGHDIHVSIALDGLKLSIDIRDKGRPMPPGSIRDAKAPDFSLEDLDDLPEGGWGLMLIGAYMDETDYVSREGENTLKLRKCVALGDESGGSEPDDQVVTTHDATIQELGATSLAAPASAHSSK